MIYNVDFLIAALVFLLIILYHFAVQRPLGPADDRTFLVFILLGVGDILFDLLSTWLITLEDPALRGVTEATLFLLYMMQLLVPYTLFYYIESLRTAVAFRKRLAQVLWALPLIVMMLLVFSNHWSGLLFRITPEGQYLRGPLYLCMYAHAGLYLLTVAVNSLIHRRELSRLQFRAIWEFLLVTSACVAVQTVFNDVLTTGFGICLGVTILYLTINNPFRYTDTLTGALDVQYFREMAQERIGHNKPLHLLAVELVQMKRVNAMLGVSAGDRMLVQIAQVLRTLSPAGLVFRSAGTRFLLVTGSLAEYEAARAYIQQYFSAPLQQDGESIQFPAVICGVLDGESLGGSDVLLSYVDYLVSSASRTGETTTIQGDERTLYGFHYSQEIERFLVTAMEEDLFEVYYQPVYSTTAGGYVTLEALSRLRHPNLGPVPPEVFIGIAEKNDQISRIGLLQFRRICRFLQAHPELFTVIRNVKVNLSPAELLKVGHCRRLIDTISEFGLSPDRFQFEITETVATQYSDDLFQAVSAFQQAGIGLCLDDFGSGYANLNTVLQLPFAVVKLDRSLLTGICETEKVAAFYQSIVSVMTDMGYRVIAEGVETQEELEMVCQWGVTMIQGYYFSRPLPEDQLLDLVLNAPEKSPEDAPV